MTPLGMVALPLWLASAGMAEPVRSAPDAPDGAERSAQVERLEAQVDDLVRDNRELRAQIERVEAALAQESPGGALVSYRSVTVREGQRVEEAVSMGSDVIVEGHVDGDAVSIGGSVHVGPTGRVGGDAVSLGGSVEVAEGGIVEGDRVSLGPGERDLAPLAVSTDPHHASGALALAGQASGVVQAVYDRLVFLLTLAGAGVVTVGLFPRRVARVAADLEERPVRSAIVGVLGPGLLTLFAALFTLITVGVGSPVGLLVVLGLGAAWLLGFVGFCHAIGDRLPVQHRHHGRWLAFLAGVLVVGFMGSLPWMGWLVVLMVSVIGTGSAISTRFGAH